jgi:hypothetical protein
MRDLDGRDASLDLSGEDLRALPAGVRALVEREVAAARSGPVLELSRRFRALKLWATLRFYGARRLAATIGQDIRHAAHLAQLDAHNERILHALQRDGRASLSNATIDGRFAPRACITNFRTTRADVKRVLTIVRELAG